LEHPLAVSLVVVVVVADEQMVTVAVAAVGIWLAEAAAVTVAMTAVVVGAEPAELFEERIVLLAVLPSPSLSLFSGPSSPKLVGVRRNW
jgi:hypothetical protein